MNALIKQNLSATPDPDAKLSRLRHLGVFLGTALASFGFYKLTGSSTVYTLVGLNLVILSAAFVNLIPKLAAQIVSRAILWQTLVLGTLVVLDEMGGYHGRDFFSGLMMLGGSVGALAAAGRVGLTRAHGTFAPAAFRAGLTASIVAALADTQALLFYGALHVESAVSRSYSLPSYNTIWSSHVEMAVPFFLAAGLMGVAVAGLFRLRTWAVALNVITNLAVAACAFTGVLALPKVLAVGLLATAVLQLIIPIPMLRTIARNARRA